MSNINVGDTVTVRFKVMEIHPVESDVYFEVKGDIGFLKNSEGNRIWIRMPLAALEMVKK
jgi:hypothetical protein